MTPHLPNDNLTLFSTLDATGKLYLSLKNVPITNPGVDDVIIEVAATAINPSDLLTLLPGNTDTELHFSQGQSENHVVAQLPPAVAAAYRQRVGLDLSVGLAGAGRVVAAGANAQDLIGKRVTALSLTRGFFAQYCTVSQQECIVLPDTVSCANAADVLCNPMTALGIVETVKLEGHSAFIHTAAASNIGQMLVKICQREGIEIINVVRREAQAELLRSLGARYICNSSAPSFAQDLQRAIEQTGARLVMDAIGGGAMVHQLLSAIESAAAAQLPGYSPYGSFEAKGAYIYGRLDTTPLYLEHQNYGVIWDVKGWVLPLVTAQIGPEKVTQLQQRIIAEIDTTFASHYGHSISLQEAIKPEVIADYRRLATGQKFLITPSQ